MHKKTVCHIGTSGWHYDHWRGPFYPTDLPAKDFLSFYARHFRAVEINNSFYHLPAKRTLKQWARTVDEGFCFAVKASRYITHMKKLKDPAESLRLFLDTIAVLGQKRGPVLFQLPPRWRCNADRLRAFLEQLPIRWPVVFEFRDETWFNPTVYTLLSQANAAFCIYELAGLTSPEVITADVVYVRLHGPTTTAYQGCYSDRQLADWADKLCAWAWSGKRVYCFFDNDQNAFAAQNALTLQRMIAERFSGR
jgi:uncharacterized protein YecE (DUF72 family)